MNLLSKIFIFLIFILSLQNVYAEVFEVENVKLQNLINEGVPIIDIRREEEWVSTGVIKNSKLLTFFDKDGNYNIKKWMKGVEKIVHLDKPFILICRTGRRTNIVANYLSKEMKYKYVYDAKGGIKSWLASGKQTVNPK
tara:strand:+ start:31 stop:447 length:417 start_codon:yes stop_codon:yes gene_type:complete